MEACNDASATAVLHLPGAPETLVVERFDRMRVGGGVVRIHQEDCAQALGLDPGNKYASVGSPKKSDPTFQAIAGLLTAYAEDPFEEKKKLLRHVFVNLVIGNADAHAKNYALLHPDARTISLAPLYDVVPTCEITPQVHAMGMRIDGRIRIDRISVSNLEAEARSWGLPRRAVLDVLEDASRRLDDGIVVANGLYPAAGKRHADATRRRVDAFWRDDA